MQCILKNSHKYFASIKKSKHDYFFMFFYFKINRMIVCLFQKISLLYIQNYKSINNADNYIQNIEKFMDTKVIL